MATEQLDEAELNEETEKELVIPGVLGGVVAGVSGLILASVLSALSGHGPFWPLRLIGATVYRNEDNLHGTAPVLIGLGLLLLASAALGVIFAAIVPRGAPWHTSTVAGLSYGLVIFLLTQWLVLPWLDPVFFRNVPAIALLACDLVYGAVLPVVISLRHNATAEDTLRHRRELRA